MRVGDCASEIATRGGAYEIAPHCGVSPSGDSRNNRH